MTAPERVVIVGGGAGGLELAAALGRARQKAFDVTLVDRAAFHLWKPRLHEVAAGLIGSGEDEISYLALAQENHFRFRMGPLTKLNAAARTITIGTVRDSEGADLLGPREIAYDRLVLAFGSQVNDFGVEGVLQHCHMLDSGEQALVFNRRLLEAAVRASEGSGDGFRIGIVGAGATGVELAVELHRSVAAMQRYGGLAAFPRLDITLVDMAPRVLAQTDPATSAFALRALQHLGVTVKLNAGVERVTAEGLVLKGGETIPCGLKVWASGIIGRPLAASLAGVQVDRLRRIVCDGTLRCTGTESIFALGDCALVLDQASQRPLPATAQVAHQQAAYLARRFRRLGRRGQEEAFRYQPRGTLVSLGSLSAAGEIPASKSRLIRFRGVVPKALYLALEFLHRAAILRWPRAIALGISDLLRGSAAPPVKLH